MDDIGSDLATLRQLIQTQQLPDYVALKLEGMLARLERAAASSSYSEEYERVAHYIEWVTHLPWGKQTQDQIDLEEAQRVLDQHHYGLQSVKNRILEHLATVKLVSQSSSAAEAISQAPILCLVGLAGTGKTTLAYAIAQAMGRSYTRIPFGGLGSARDLRGQSRLHLESEPGQVVKALIASGSMNPVMLLDEIDRVAKEAKADVMGVLLELLDPGQNNRFVDHYLDIPVNLSGVLFIATANNIDTVSTAVLNRLEIIEMPTYTDDDKIHIGTHYLLPEALKAAGLQPGSMTISEEVWPMIVRPLGFDSGIRLLKRALETAARRLALQFAKGNTVPVVIRPDNLRQFFDQY